MPLPEPYGALLAALPGVRSFQVLGGTKARLSPGKDPVLKLRTAAGVTELIVQIKTSHLSHVGADHVIALAKSLRCPLLVLAPHVGAGLGSKLDAAGVNYLDAQGNCHIAAPPLFIHIEGKSRAVASQAGRGMRAAGYEALFALLVEPELLGAPVRTVADRAGVSRQTVSDIRRRLLEDEYLLEAKTGIAWNPRRVNDALDLWLRGYETSVRPSLLRQTFRTQRTEPDELEPLVEEAAMKTHAEHKWGGAAAGFRLTGHYRGQRTVVHVRAPADAWLRHLRARPDPNGNLVVMDAFGAINWDAERQTVHPLLVYAEMLAEGGERAREAAAEVYERFVAPKLGGRR